MHEVQADYLVVGAGAGGLDFTDTLLSQSDGDVIVVDRRSGPGGHWNDAYPFVQLHQPSCFYGVDSMPLGDDRIDTSGINGGSCERATAPEVLDYFQRVMSDRLLPSGRVRYSPLHDFDRGEDGT